MAQKHAATLLAALSAQYKGNFDDFTYKKIVNSHSIYITIIFDAFVRLHGRNTTKQEKKRSIYYFICSSLFDNFWDNHSHSIEELKELSFNSTDYIPKNFDDAIFKFSHEFLLQEVNNLKDYIAVSHLVFNAQHASLQQFDATISNEKIQEITFAKGGNSVLLCKFYVDVAASTQETNCWYLIGTLIQLGNDLFDIYKDTQQDIHTLATRCKNAYELEKVYRTQVTALQQEIKKLPQSKYKKTEFSVSLAATYALGLVALQQLKQLQGNQSELPNFKTVARKLLIVDMQQLKNLIRWITFIYKEAKL